MALIAGGILELMWILGYDFSGRYNRLDLTSGDIISGVNCISMCNLHLNERIDSLLLIGVWQI